MVAGGALQGLEGGSSDVPSRWLLREQTQGLHRACLFPCQLDSRGAPPKSPVLEARGPRLETHSRLSCHFSHLLTSPHERIPLPHPGNQRPELKWLEGGNSENRPPQKLRESPMRGPGPPRGRQFWQLNTRPLVASCVEARPPQWNLLPFSAPPSFGLGPRPPRLQMLNLWQHMKQRFPL